MSAIPLVIFHQDGSCEANPEALAHLEQIRKPVAVVAVAGRYRTGKSFLLNKVLLRTPPDGGFQVGPTTQPCTKGLWLWTDPVHDEDHCTLVVDTEGTGATNSDDNRDTRIFALALLLSSYFVYNSQGSIDEPALANLQVVTNVSKMVRVSAEDVSPFAGAFGDAPPECKDIGDFFPHFLWVVRDFILELRSADGEAIEESEYLEEALRDHKGDGDKAGLRAALKRAFPHRDCCTLVRPVSDEKQLRHLDTMSEADMRPEFVVQAHALRRKVLEGAPPKQLDGNIVNGPALAGLCRCYVEAINTGAAPVIQNAWAMVCADQCHRASKEATETWDAAIRQAEEEEEEAGGGEPVDPWTAGRTLRQAFASAEALYEKQAVGEQREAGLAELRRTLEERTLAQSSQWSERWRSHFHEQASGLLADTPIEGLTLQEVLEQMNHAFRKDDSADADSAEWEKACRQEQLFVGRLAGAFPTKIGTCVKQVCAEWESQVRTAQEERMEALQGQMRTSKRLAEIEEEARTQRAAAEAAATTERQRAAELEKQLREQAESHAVQQDEAEERHRTEKSAATSAVQDEVQKLREEMTGELQQGSRKCEALQTELQAALSTAEARQQELQRLEEEAERQQAVVQELRQAAQRATVAETQVEDLTRTVQERQGQVEEAQEALKALETEQTEQIAELTKTWKQRQKQTESSRREQCSQLHQQVTDLEAELTAEKEAVQEQARSAKQQRDQAAAADRHHAEEIQRLRDEISQKTQAMLEQQKSLESRMQTSRGRSQEELDKLQEERRQADQDHLRKELAMHKEAHELKSKGEVLEVKVREANHRLHEVSESLSKKRSRCEDLEQSVVELESLRHQKKWLEHRHNEQQRTLTTITQERDRLMRDHQQDRQKQEHRLSTLEVKNSTKDEQIVELKTQLEGLTRKEAALRKENASLKKLVHQV